MLVSAQNESILRAIIKICIKIHKNVVFYILIMDEKVLVLCEK